jgi:pimeloyl-ACP methyl ester carboxylesterase
MDQKYRKWKLISTGAEILFVILSVSMVVDVSVVYLKWPSYLRISAPDQAALLHAIFYIPGMAAAFAVNQAYLVGIQKEFPDKIRKRQKLTGKILIKKLLRATAAAGLIFLLLLIVVPFIVLPVFLNRHVNYLGYETENNPLQDIYLASEFGLEETQRYLDTEDGLKVWTSEIYTEQPKAVIIYLTGITQPSVTYFYGHAKLMKENGFASILLELRGHGKSEGRRICLGYEEVKDVRAVVEYIKKEEKYKGVPVILQGLSMGGAVSVNAFGQIKEIDALIAMSPYSSFEDVITDKMKALGMPGFIRSFEKPLIRQALRQLFGSEAVNSMKPVVQIKNAGNRPVLLIACADDTEVPVMSLQRLKKANPKIQTWIRTSWEHLIVKNCILKNVAMDTEYCKKVLDFINNTVMNSRE